MPKFKFSFLPDIPLPSPCAIRDAIGNRVMFWTPEPLTGNSDGDGFNDLLDLQPADHASATLVTSKLDDNYMHKPVIDIDLPCMLVPSTAPGHFHLYIDREMPWDKFVAILEALEDASVVGHGYVQYAKRRGFASVRYPGVTKHNEADRIREAKIDRGIEEFDDEDF